MRKFLNAILSALWITFFFSFGTVIAFQYLCVMASEFIQHPVQLATSALGVFLGCFIAFTRDHYRAKHHQKNKSIVA